MGPERWGDEIHLHPFEEELCSREVAPVLAALGLVVEVLVPKPEATARKCQRACAQGAGGLAISACAHCSAMFMSR